MRGEKSTVGTSRNFSAKGNFHHRERIPDLTLLLLRKSSLSIRTVDCIEQSQSARHFPAVSGSSCVRFRTDLPFAERPSSNFVFQAEGMCHCVTVLLLPS